MRFIEVTLDEFLEDRKSALLSADPEAVKAYAEKYNVPYMGMSDVVIMRGAMKALKELRSGTGNGRVSKNERDAAIKKYKAWLLDHGYTKCD